MSMQWFRMIITGNKEDIKRAIDLLQTDKKLLMSCINNSYISVFEGAEVFVSNDFDVLVLHSLYENGNYYGCDYLAKAIPEIEILYKGSICYGGEISVTVNYYMNGKEKYSADNLPDAEYGMDIKNMTDEEIELANESYGSIYGGYEYVIKIWEREKQNFKRKTGKDYEFYEKLFSYSYLLYEYRKLKL